VVPCLPPPAKIMDKGVPQLSFASINCNSLNSSQISSMHHKLKIYAIAKLKTDIIFLSDTRLHSNSSNTTESIRNSFRINPYESYDCHFNATGSSRGVGILLKHSLNISVLEEARDGAGNVLGLVVQHQGKKFLIIAIYGPNNTCDAFFNDLSGLIRKHANMPLVVGGDWNLTQSPLPANLNLDVINMQKIPNESHTKKLLKLQLEFKLVDPFRILHPNRRDFSYIPRDKTKTNRSRIDFFIVSRHWLEPLSDCSISNSLQSSLFDHKAIFLSTIPKKRFSKIDTILSATTNDILTEFIVNLSAFECYLHHFDVSSPEENLLKDSLLNKIGTAKKEVREATKILHPQACHKKINEYLLDQKITNIRTLIDDLSQFNIPDFKVNIDYDIFLDYYVNCIRNDVISHQRFLTKHKIALKKELCSEIETLKQDYESNFQELSVLESRLNALLDLELKAEVENFRHFEILKNEKITPEFVKLAKSLNTDYSLDDICDDEGNVFSSNSARGKYIVDFFSKIYRKPACDKNRPENTIENFLGPEIINNPVVQNSKLTDVEKIL
jgi:exonuclease III